MKCPYILREDENPIFDKIILESNTNSNVKISNSNIQFNGEVITKWETL